MFETETGNLFFLVPNFGRDQGRNICSLVLGLVQDFDLYIYQYLDTDELSPITLFKDGDPDAFNGLGDINKIKMTSFIFRLDIVYKAKAKNGCIIAKTKPNNCGKAETPRCQVLN